MIIDIMFLIFSFIFFIIGIICIYDGLFDYEPNYRNFN